MSNSKGKFKSSSDSEAKEDILESSLSYYSSNQELEYESE